MSAEEMIVEVAPLSDAVPGTLGYGVPEGLREQIAEGVAVTVPLRTRLVAGIVVGLHSSSDGDIATSTLPREGRDYELKPVHSVLDSTPALNVAQLQLARWMSEEYCAAIGRCCALMIPPGLTPSSAFIYSLADPGAQTDGQPAPGDTRSKVIEVLQQRGPLLESKLKTALRGARRWRGALKGLLESGTVVRQSTLEPAIVVSRRTTMAQLSISDATLGIVFENLDREAIRQPHRAAALERRAGVLTYLQQHNRMAWAEWIYAETGANRTDLEWLAQRDYVILGDAQRWRDPLADIDYVVSVPPSLTTDQARAWEAVRAAMLAADTARQLAPFVDGTTAGPTLGAARMAEGHHSQFLLRGVTGSGKTEVYMRAVDAALQQGRGALVLVPEISLTPQTARRFLSRFPGKVALIHSRLKPGERYDTWRRIRAGELSVVVGARSALFAPLRHVGVIVLDEEHDQSYKQGSPPYYDTRRVAMRYAELSGATLIMGSATPSLEAWRLAQVNALRVLELPNRVRGHVKRVADQQTRLGVRSVAKPETESVVYQPLPDVQVVDMRAELRGGNLGMFSGALSLALSETLQRGEQAILFLNRRGSASCVICRDCGHAMRCLNDDTPLTYHQDSPETTGLTQKGKQSDRVHDRTSILKCHQCDHVEGVPVRCPTCGGPRIRFVGIGTQKVEQTVHEQYPRARVVRWDKDASSASGRTSADQLLQRFVNQQADVLVGTQMIAKGLDLPLVTLVGVVLADVGLFLPDFRAAERIFDLVEQVAGRAGRSLLAGRVIVQTYNPDHPAISFASHHDVVGFAQFELAQRKLLSLPPYVRLVRIETTHADNVEARKACEMLARQLRKRIPNAGDLIGPAQAYFARRSNRFRWQLFVRTQSPQGLLQGLDVPRDCVVDVDPINML